MMKVKGIFAVSFIAMMVVGGAYAEIASSGYVDEKIDGLATVAKTGAYGDLSGAPTVHNATLTIQKNGTSAGTFTANASANKTINITVPTQTSDLDNDSGFITSANLPVATANTLGGVKSGGDITVASTGAVTVSHATKADTATSATSAASATKATQDASGNVITSTYATKTEVGSKLSSISGSTGGTGNVVTSVSASGSTVSATKGITAEETKNKVTSVRAAASATDTAYPSEKAVATALAAKADKSELSGYATTSAVTGLIPRVSRVEGNLADLETAVYDEESGLEATNAIADSALSTAQSAQTKANAALPKATYDSQVGTVSATNMGTSASTVVGAIKEVAGEAAAAQTAANAKVATAQGSGNANKAVITNSSGNITTGTISSGMIANDAVTSAKLAAGAVDATALASDAVTSAKIADGTIVNADISASAAIAASKISGLATVATSGSYDDLADKPTIPAAITVDSALSSTSTNPVQNKVINAAINTAQTAADNAAEAAAAAQTAATNAQNAVNNLDVSTASGSGNVVTSVTQENGKIAVTKGNVQIPVGSAAATSYATIWVQ